MQLFPSGIAEGEAFCNRVEERKRLTNNINKVVHTILIAPRRYGKTSLIKQVMHENSFNYEWVDFLSVTTREQVEDKISRAAKALLFKLSPDLIKLTKQTVDFVKSMSPELNLGAMGQSLTLHLTSNQKIPIDEMLLQIDEYAQKLEKRGVLVFDEFQQISELDQHSSVEALIRHAVERSKAITYIFSGSNRHLLQEMFSKSSRPLYRLCQAMPIERIEKGEYEKFLNNAAHKRWGKKLNVDAIDEILKLAECHPFYINALCNELWTDDELPSQDEVTLRWSWYVETHKSIIISDIISLPLNQKKVGYALAEQPTLEPSGNDLCIRTKLSTSSIRRALDYLLSKDIVYMNTSGVYGLLDPAVRYYMVNT